MKPTTDGVISRAVNTLPNYGRPRDGGPAAVVVTSAWGPVFIGIAVLVSIAIHVVVVTTTHLSASSDVVFGGEALVSGIISDQILRTGFRRRIVILFKWKLSFIWIWTVLCAYVIIARPFE